MHRLLVTYPNPPEPEHFLDYYFKHHLPLARTLPGLLDCRYIQPQALDSAGEVAFLLFEADFADAGAMFDALGSVVGAKVAADVSNYSPGGATLMHYDVPAR